MARRGVVLAVLLGGLWAMKEAHLASLLAWTERCFPVERYPYLFACFFLTWVLVRTRTDRRAALLIGGCATALVFDPMFLVLAVAWLAIFHAILFGAAPRLRAALAFVVATYVALGLLSCTDLWPDWLAEHPYVPRWCYVFALSFTFRLAWLLHEVRLRRERWPFADVLAYFVFAPFFVIVPYMIAIPRSDRFRASLAKHDPAIESSGLRLLAWGIALSLLAALSRATWDPRNAFQAYLEARDIGRAALIAVPYYPIIVTLEACAIGSILVGMTRILGIDLGKSFDAPLLATDVTAWWRRWNVHFRDLLVELYYYPALMRLRRKPDRAIVVGCFRTFIVGSMLLHYPKFVLGRGTFSVPPLGLFVEDTLMCVLVALALVRRRRRGPEPPMAWPRRIARMVRTWIVVMLVVVAAGYGAQYFVQPRPTPTAPWSLEFGS